MSDFSSGSGVSTSVNERNIIWFLKEKYIYLPFQTKKSGTDFSMALHIPPK